MGKVLVEFLLFEELFVSLTITSATSPVKEIKRN